MTPLAQAYENKAKTIIKALERGNMEGTYFSTKEEAKAYALQLIPDGSVISWGGSMTVDTLGIKESLRNREVTCLDREKATSLEETKEIYRRAFGADYFLMSSNAITMDGKLINIDATGNRVAALIFGPEHVLVFVGMNKVVTDEREGISRVHNIASPPNVNRIGLKTPCSTTGFCHDCHSEGCICCNTVITRHSRQKGRIQVLLIGESLGF